MHCLYNASGLWYDIASIFRFFRLFFFVLLNLQQIQSLYLHQSSCYQRHFYKIDLRTIFYFVHGGPEVVACALTAFYVTVSLLSIYLLLIAVNSFYRRLDRAKHTQPHTNTPGELSPPLCGLCISSSPFQLDIYYQYIYEFCMIKIAAFCPLHATTANDVEQQKLDRRQQHEIRTKKKK